MSNVQDWFREKARLINENYNLKRRLDQLESRFNQMQDWVNNQAIPTMQALVDKSDANAEASQNALSSIQGIQDNIQGNIVPQLNEALSSARDAATKAVNASQLADVARQKAEEVYQDVKTAAQNAETALRKAEAAFKRAWDNFNKFKTNFVTAWREMYHAFNDAANDVVAIANEMNTLAHNLINRVKEINACWSYVWGVPTLTHPFKFMSETRTAFNQLKDAYNFFRGKWLSFQSKFNTIRDTVGSLYVKIVNWE